MNPLQLLLAVLLVCRAGAEVLRPAHVAEAIAVLEALKRNQPPASDVLPTQLLLDAHDETALNDVDQAGDDFERLFADKNVDEKDKKTLATLATKYGIAAGTVAYVVAIVGFSYLVKISKDLVSFQDLILQDLYAVTRNVNVVNTKLTP